MPTTDILNVFLRFKVSVEAGVVALDDFVRNVAMLKSSCLPREFVLATLHAIRSDDWSDVSRHFADMSFIGYNGWFLFIGPYTSKVNGTGNVQLTGVYGKAYMDLPQLNPMPLLSEFFPRSGRIATVIPFDCLCSFGIAGGADGEAFLVPDGWAFGGELGPALNDMTKQQNRFDLRCTSRLPLIFEPNSSDLLLECLNDVHGSLILRHTEFQLHEAGHASGLGLTNKLSLEAAFDPWCGGVEEWRSDGVAFRLAMRMHSSDEVARIIAANYCLRFGVDAQRPGGLDNSDVIASILTLDSLLKGGNLLVDSDKLRFRRCDLEGLRCGVLTHCNAAMQLTAAESVLDNVEASVDLYRGIRIESATENLFQQIVRPASSFQTG